MQETIRFKPRYLIGALILICPFVVFYWTMPFISRLTIGNDYGQFSLQEQMNLLFSVRMGSFPLYIPGYDHGQLAIALTQGQLFHPVTWLACLFPAYWSINPLEVVTAVSLFSLGLIQLILYAFIRGLKVNRTFSFVISFITVYNLRMLDLFRFGASLQNYTGYLLLCAAVLRCFIKPNRYSSPLFVVAATYLLTCGGNPQMMYYGLLGAALVMFITPAFMAGILPGSRTSLSGALRYYARTGIYILIGLLLSSAYILPFYFDFVVTNIERASSSFEWSISYFNYGSFLDALNGIFRPFESNIHGSFAGSSLFLVALLLPLLLLFRRPAGSGVIILIYSFIALTFVLALGDLTPLYGLFWKYFPFVSTFRIPGRITMILPFLFLLLLVWLIRLQPIQLHFRRKHVRILPVGFLAAGSIALYLVYRLIPADNTLNYLPSQFHLIPAWARITVISCGVLGLAITVVFSILPRHRWCAAALLILSVVLQTTCLMRYSTWVIEKRESYSFGYEEILERQKERLGYVGIIGYGRAMGVVSDYSKIIRQRNLEKSLWSYTRQLKHADRAGYGMRMRETGEYRRIDKKSEDDSLAIITWNYAYVKTRKEALDRLDSNIENSRFLIEGDPVPRSAVKEPRREAKINLEYSSFNRLLFRADTTEAGLFVLRYPLTPHWQARVNGKQQPLLRANGLWQAVELASGESLIEFRCQPIASLWGMLISCLIGLLLLFFISGAIQRKKVRTIVRMTAICAVILAFTSWYYSLHHGKNIGTRYTWQSTGSGHTE